MSDGLTIRRLSADDVGPPSDAYLKRLLAKEHVIALTPQ
jgi:hypothetical protein